MREGERERKAKGRKCKDKESDGEESRRQDGERVIDGEGKAEEVERGKWIEKRSRDCIAAARLRGRARKGLTEEQKERAGGEQ